MCGYVMLGFEGFCSARDFASLPLFRLSSFLFLFSFLFSPFSLSLGLFERLARVEYCEHSAGRAG